MTKRIFGRLFRLLAAALATFATGEAEADTMTVMGDDVTICSSATSLNQLGISTLTGTINFYTPSGCSAGDKLVFTKLEMLKSTGNTANTKTNATTITITVDGVKYTSSPVVDSSAPSSLGNVTSGIGSDHHLLTYNFPNVIVEAGSSYDVSFNGSGLTELRCRMESAASGTVFTAPVSATGNWKPFGVITAAPVLASTPVIGSRIILGNTGTSGAISDSGAGECNISLTIPAFSGLPVGSVVRVKNVSLAGWNDSFTDWDATNKKSDPYFIKINNIISKSLQGTTTNPGSAPSIDLTVSKMQANDSTTLNRLFFEYANTCDLTVGTSYAAPAQDANSAATGLALCYRNGNLIFSKDPKDVGGVRYVEAATASILSSTAATGAYPIYEMLLEVVSKPAQTATIDAEGSYTLTGLFSSTAADGVYAINVNESATLDIDAAATVDHITFNIASGKTLTLTGNTLTASEIALTGEGVATTQNMSIFSGTLAGDGTLCYDMNNGTTKPSGIVCTSDDWAGLLWIKNGAYTGWNFNTEDSGYIKYGSANSTLRLENVECFLNSTETVGFTLDLHGEGLKITKGNGYKVETVKKLTGSGTLAISGGSSYGNGFIIQDGSEFAGSIDITTGNYVVNFADSGTYANSTTGGKIIVGSGKSATVASGKTWSTNNRNGIEINGTLTLADSTSTLTGTISGSGTLVANQQFPVPGSSFTGTLTISGDGTSGTYCSETEIYGSRLNVAEGYVILTGDITTLPDSIDIQSGATLYFYECPATSLSLKMGTWNGMLYFYNCTALTTLTLDAGAKRSFSMTDDLTLPAETLTTVNLVLDEVKGEGGTITLSNTAAISAIAGRTYNFTVNGLDGRTKSGTYDSATSTITYTPSISGAATMYDVTFTNTFAFAQKKTAAAYIYCDNTATYNNTLNDATTGLYIRCNPWTGEMASDMYGLSDFTAVVVGQMSPTANRIFIHIGSSYGSRTGLVIVTTENKDEVAIMPNTGGTVDTSKAVTVKIPNAASSRHAYVIRRSGNTFTVSVDGITRGNFTVSDGFKLGTSDHSGIQVGSDFGAGIKNNTNNDYAAVANSEAETGVVNLIRLYDYVLTEAQERALTDLYPYISEGGLYTRTISANANLSYTDAWTKEGDDTLYTLPEGATVDEVAYDPSVTITVSETAALTVNASLAVDTLTIQSASGATLTFSTDGTHSMAVSGAVVVNSPLVVEYGSLNLAGTPVQLGSGGSINFDCSAMDVSAIYSTTRYQLTGLVTRDDNNITATLPPSVAYRTSSLEYNSNGYYELVVTPNHEDGAEVYFKSGYLKGNMAVSGSGEVYVDSSFTTRTALFPNDVMVVNDNSTLWQNQLFMDTSFAGNIRFSRTTAATLRNGEVAGTFLAGCTVTVDEGCSLTIARHSSGNYALTLADVTVNGTGTATLSDPMSVSGAVSGTAALTISGTVNVASGGSIANAVAGAGTIAYAAIPAATPSSFTGWTGTVSLPSFNASSGINFNRYGTTGSTIVLAGMTGGYILEAGKTVAPTLRLDGAMNITAMSTWTYIFAEITGTGNLSFPTSENSPAVTITKVAEGYSGTITSTLATPVEITTLARAAGASTAAGAKLLDTGSATSVTVGAVTVGGVAAELDLVYKDDGVYVSELQGAGYWDGTTAVITNSEETVTVPSGATALRIYPSANDTSLVLTAEQAQTLVLYSSYEIGETSYSQDITSAFTASTPVQVDGGQKITLSLSATDGNSPTTVTVDEETISVAPALAAAAPMTLDANAKPTFAVKTIPGLWYRVEAGTEMDGTSLGGTGMAGASVQATSTSTALAAPEFPEDGNVLFYKIAVGISRDDIEPAEEP